MGQTTHSFRALGFALAVCMPLLLPANPAVAEASVATDVEAHTFPSLSLTDQHNRPVALPSSARWILFAHSKDGDEWSNPALEEMGQSGMTARGLVYLSDISAMPSLVTKMFAMPALRARKYSVALIREEGQAKGIPAKKDCVSLIGLHDGRISSTEMLCSAAVVKKTLEALPLR